MSYINLLLLLTWSDSKVRELIAVKVLHTSSLNTTVVAFKILPLGSYAPMPAPTPSFKTILELVLWNGLQSCHCVTSDVINVIKMPSFQYFLYHVVPKMDTVVSILSYGIRVPTEARDLFFPQNVQTASGGHTASLSFGSGLYFPGIKRAGRKLDRLHPYSAEVSNMWGYTPKALYAFKRVQRRLYLLPLNIRLDVNPNHPLTIFLFLPVGKRRL